MGLFGARRVSDSRNGLPDRATPPDTETSRTPFTGEFYVDFLSKLSAKRNSERYLEIGVRCGRLLAAIHAQDATGVDPAFALEHDVSKSRRKTTLYQCTSDEYFRTLARDEKFDLIFIDGLHMFEYALRDFYNAERAARPGALIVLHDCLPVAATMIERLEDDAVAISEGTKFDGWWTGDVWKLIPILQEARPDLRIVAVDCSPTGLLCITRLDPASDALQRNYLDIVQKYKSLPNTWDSVQRMYETIEVIPSAAIIKDMDHSLYFEN